MFALVLLGILVALQIADVLTTHKFLSLGVRERNSFARWGFEKFGFWPFCIVGKTLATVPAALIAFFFPGYWIFIMIHCMINTFAVVGNFEAISDNS